MNLWNYVSSVWNQGSVWRTGEHSSFPTTLDPVAKFQMSPLATSNNSKRKPEATKWCEHTYTLHAGRGQHCQSPGCFPPARSLGICPHSGRCAWFHLLLSWDWHMTQQCHLQNPPGWGISGGLPVVKEKGSKQALFCFWQMGSEGWLRPTGEQWQGLTDQRNSLHWPVRQPWLLKMPPFHVTCSILSYL